ncbi:phosphatase PAP2 family protein [Mycolicibacterium sp. CBM1]
MAGGRRRWAEPARQWHNLGIGTLTFALVGFGLLMAAGVLIGGSRWGPALIVLGLVTALAGVTIGVCTQGWVTALDGPTASVINQCTQRCQPLRAVAAEVARIGNPAAVAIAGVISGALLSIRYRSLVPGIVVVGTTGFAVFVKDFMKATIERPVSAAEAAAAPGLSEALHPFPSGHVAGTATLLGVVAVGIGAHSQRVLRGMLVTLAVAGALIVSVSRLMLGAHWLSDIFGGALLAGIAVTLGAVTLSTTTRARRRRPAAHRAVVQRRRVRSAT